MKKGKGKGGRERKRGKEEHGMGGGKEGGNRGTKCRRGTKGGREGD